MKYKWVSKTVSSFIFDTQTGLKQPPLQTKQQHGMFVCNGGSQRGYSSPIELCQAPIKEGTAISFTSVPNF